MLVGPTEESNWLIPGKLIVGCCPLSLEEAEDIAREGVDMFVCLLDRDDFSSRISKKKYKSLARSVGIDVIFKPIADGDITTDKKAFSIARMIFQALKTGHVVYLHCWGGHGRAGTIGAMVLGLWWYRVPFEEVIAFLQKAHQTRSEGGQYPTPQTKDQIDQVVRFFEKEYIPIFSSNCDFN